MAKMRSYPFPSFVYINLLRLGDHSTWILLFLMVDAIVRRFVVIADGRTKGRGTSKLTLEEVVGKNFGFCISWNTMPLTELNGENGSM